MIAGMMLVTFGARYPVLALFGRIPLPNSVFRALTYVPPAVLAAIIFPAVLMPDGAHVFISLQNAPLIAGLAAALIGWWRRNLLLTIVVGMGTLWIWQWMIG